MKRKVLPPQCIPKDNNWFRERMDSFEDGKDYIFLEDYINSKTPIKFKHLICGKEFKMRPIKFLSGQRCQCQNKYRPKTKEEVIIKLKEIYDLREYLILDIDDKKYAIIKHLECDRIFKVSQSHWYRGDLCPYKDCKNKRRSIIKMKSHEQFCAEVKDLSNGEYKVVGIYSGDKNPIKIKHVSCGRQFNIIPTIFLQKGTKCPDCYKTISQAEMNMRLILEDLNLEYVTEKTYEGLVSENNVKLRFDFYIPDKNILIELDGEQHYKPARWSNDKNKNLEKFNMIQLHDRMKTEYCNKNNISLLRIPYWNFKNMRKILENFLLKNK